jgi:hypothetical protein
LVLAVANGGGCAIGGVIRASARLRRRRLLCGQNTTTPIREKRQGAHSGDRLCSMPVSHGSTKLIMV